jgi:hypothetical protein
MRRSRKVPDWLIGLAIAIVVVTILFFVFDIGDTPTLGT